MEESFSVPPPPCPNPWPTIVTVSHILLYWTQVCVGSRVSLRSLKEQLAQLTGPQVAFGCAGRLKARSLSRLWTWARERVCWEISQSSEKLCGMFDVLLFFGGRVKTLWNNERVSFLLTSLFLARLSHHHPIGIYRCCAARFTGSRASCEVVTLTNFTA